MSGPTTPNRRITISSSAFLVGVGILSGILAIGGFLSHQVFACVMGVVLLVFSSLYSLLRKDDGS